MDVRHFIFFFLLSQDVLKSFVRQVYVNAMLAQYVFLYLAIKADYLFLIMLGRLNARTRFQAMAEESIPLSTINLGETSSQSAARESQPVRF